MLLVHNDLQTAHDPLHLMQHSETVPPRSIRITLLTTYKHPQQTTTFISNTTLQFNTNYIPQLMQDPKDSSYPTTAMNTALALLAKEFKVNTIPTNNTQRSSLIPCNSQIAQSGMNTSQDIKMKMVVTMLEISNYGVIGEMFSIGDGRGPKLRVQIAELGAKERWMAKIEA
ncbi:hypothetical protein Tco_0327370 [Tanacetum coccineum]